MDQFFINIAFCTVRPLIKTKVFTGTLVLYISCEHNMSEKVNDT